jgi:hypothetical protein
VVEWLRGCVVESKGCGEQVGDPHEWRYCQDLTGVGGRTRTNRCPVRGKVHVSPARAIHTCLTALRHPPNDRRQPTPSTPRTPCTRGPRRHGRPSVHIRHAAYGGDRFVTSGAAYGTGRGPLAGAAHQRPKHPHSATRTTTGDARCKLRAARGPAGWALALANELHPICRCVCARAVGGSECRGLRHYT